MWAIINKKNDFNILHTHPNCILKCSILCKSSKKLWKISIENPNSIKNIVIQLANKKELNVNCKVRKVEEGDLLIFPALSYLMVSRK